ncbi:MAG: 4-alpha-glucanotransferase, partial [Armatimonadetes bacterium]|nr:4-alpha-glucanotransferase [Akkermansiaceae bacterium]
MKTTGILIPAFSPGRDGDLGIGDTLSLRNWIDWAARYKLGFLQLLPINENGTDESPYSGISSVAIDPIYLSFDPPEIPLLTTEDLDIARASLGPALDAHLVDYPAVRAAKQNLLETSFARFTATPSPGDSAGFKTFRQTHTGWLPDYCRFKLLIEIHGQHLTWDQWPEHSRTPKEALNFIALLRKQNPNHIDSRLDFFAYVQWLCFRQWTALRSYADDKEIKLMGDVSIGVAYHSADVFFN